MTLWTLGPCSHYNLGLAETGMLASLWLPHNAPGADRGLLLPR